MNPVSRFFYLFLASVTVTVACAADFPQLYNSEDDTNSLPLSPEETLAQLQLPPGFKATVFAAEPDVQNPIGMAWDARGRLWIAENYTYAEREKRFDLNLRDRVLIFEDKDGDGHFDSRKVYSETVQMLTSVEVGHGGVWALCPPQLLFIPDQNGDDIPDGRPEVVLDGFTVPRDNYHNFANGLRWGPDGWLYGRCGGSAPGELGLPGAPASQRIPLRGGIWRFHPQKKIVEVVAHGTMNPWGHDWNAVGELFFINTVSGHLWHMIPGAHFQTAHTIDPNQHAYQLIDMHADHWHFDTAQGWTKSREGSANSYGGGHAHIGAMIYLGDNWPREHRGNLFTWNMHGRRANEEILERTGSGYVAKHGGDQFLFGDKWFRGMDLSYGPDGGVFAIDWSDTGECHESTGVHRESGRIYKITYGETKKPRASDLTKMSVSELVKLHSHENDWFVRQARLQLAERAKSGKEFDIAKSELRKLFQTQTNSVIQLRALWSIYGIGAADEEFLRAQLHHSNEYVRVWAIRLLSDLWPLDTIMSSKPANRNGNASPALIQEFIQPGKSDPSAFVRLALASTLQRLPVSARPDLAAALLSHEEDAKDHNLPLMIWYGLIPVADANPTALVKLATDSKIPSVRKLMARRLAEDIEKNSAPLNSLLEVAAKKSDSFQSDVLGGLTDALRGWSKASQPPAWKPLVEKINSSPNEKLRIRARDLSVIFGDGRALEEVKQIALDNKTELAARRDALQTLIEKRPPDLRDICEQLLSVRFLNSTAVRGLALFDDPAIGEKLAENYSRFHPSERAAVIETLVSRTVFARPLLEEIDSKKIPRTDLTPFHVRQIRSFNDAALTKRLTEVWGELRDTPAEKEKLIADLKAKLTPKRLTSANKDEGRKIFENTCAACHTLYGKAGKVGPDLTGSGRDNLDYLLQNIIDPSAVVTADFRMTVVDLKDGRTLNGVVASKTDRTITLRTMTETLAIERSEIESSKESTLSLMPEGLFDAMNESEMRNLIAYLMDKTQTR